MPEELYYEDGIPGGCSAMSYRRIQVAFLARGECAWQEYQRAGRSRPASEVFDNVQRCVDARRQELTTRSWCKGLRTVLARGRSRRRSPCRLLAELPPARWASGGRLAPPAPPTRRPPASGRLCPEGG